jgi:hypothetical protein
MTKLVLCLVLLAVFAFGMAAGLMAPPAQAMAPPSAYFCYEQWPWLCCFNGYGQGDCIVIWHWP